VGAFGIESNRLNYSPVLSPSLATTKPRETARAVIWWAMVAYSGAMTGTRTDAMPKKPAREVFQFLKILFFILFAEVVDCGDAAENTSEYADCKRG